MLFFWKQLPNFQYHRFERKPWYESYANNSIPPFQKYYPYLLSSRVNDNDIIEKKLCYRVGWKYHVKTEIGVKYNLAIFKNCKHKHCKAMEYPRL